MHRLPAWILSGYPILHESSSNHVDWYKTISVRELYDFMADLDSAAIIYASRYKNQDEVIAELDANLKEAQQLYEKDHLNDEEVERWISLSDHFHLIFYNYCNNSRLTKAAVKQRSQLTIFSKQYEAISIPQKKIHTGHLQIFDAYRQKNYELATRLMHLHLNESLEYALDVLHTSIQINK